MDWERHWQGVYRRRGPTEVSWYQEEPAPSLAALAESGIDHHASLIDVGGGASALVDRLVDQGWSDVTVLDVAASSLAAAQERLGDRAARVHWIAHDLLTWQPDRLYDVWHDRALFHFLVVAADRSRYVEVLRRALKPGGLLIMATFAEDGPTECSGLSVQRYSSADLSEALGPEFELRTARREEHRTPAGITQAFNWGIFARRKLDDHHAERSL